MGKKFWWLTSPLSARKLAEWDESVQFAPFRCPVNPEHQGGPRAGQLSIRIPGETTEDFLWTWYSELAITPDVRRIMDAEGITGFINKPVTARCKKRPDLLFDGLSEVVVTGWGGASKSSGSERLEYCQACGYSRYTTITHPENLIDESQWDGSDMFIVWPLPRYIFISEKVFSLIRRMKWKGARMVSIADMKWPFERLSPGSLRNHLPEARAHQLGDPLGIY